MNDPVIRVESLSKAYRLGVINHGTLRYDLESWWARLRGKEDPHSLLGSSQQDGVKIFNALNSISFEVQRGEILGIIGRNGAGKSTLLKILSRTTDPTSGKIKLKGRVASLLEVGTGFHPELTGRENVFLNGAVLGMTKGEIARRFDEIVAFSGVDKFIDTPIKRYSSGMYVRLAFAVAAHLEPEIMIIDEVLAVGDAEFQKKCLGKIQDVGNEGRTVLFVSHNMQAISNLCDRTILLDQGKLTYDGKPAEVIEQYLRGFSLSAEGRSLEDVIGQLPVDPSFKLEEISLTQNGQPAGLYIESGKPLEVGVRYRVLEPMNGLRVNVDLCDDQDTLLFRSFHDEDNEGIPKMEPGTYRSQLTIPPDLLGPRCYELRVRASIHNVRSCMPSPGVRLPLNVELTGRYNRAYMADTFRGKLALALDWITEHK